MKNVCIYVYNQHKKFPIVCVYDYINMIIEKGKRYNTIAI